MLVIVSHLLILMIRERAIIRWGICLLYTSAYGVYIRHADNIRFINMKLSTIGDKEERHAVVAEDVNGLEITDSALQSPDSELSVIRLKDCKNVKVPE